MVFWLVFVNVIVQLQVELLNEQSVVSEGRVILAGLTESEGVGVGLGVAVGIAVGVGVGAWVGIGVAVGATVGVTSVRFTT
jgi:hypothetical protein